MSKDSHTPATRVGMAGNDIEKLPSPPATPDHVKGAGAHGNGAHPLRATTSRRSSRSFHSAHTQSTLGGHGTGPHRTQGNYDGGEHPTRTMSGMSARSVPIVDMFGGVSVPDDEADDGLYPVRSLQEAEDREREREEKGPDPWAVTFESGEKANPKNWSVAYRWYLTVLGGMLVLNSTFASSAPSGIVASVQGHFHVSSEVVILTLSLFVAGYCVGPLLWGPLSEIYGRRPVFIGAFIFYVGMQVGCALAPNIGALLAFRFIGGLFAAAPLTNAGALIADIWDADRRGTAMALFGLAPFAGPSVGPIVSGAIEVSGISWRWVYWILTIFAGCCLLVIVFTLPETYAPVILVKKAKRLRKETGDDRWYAPLERRPTDFKTRIKDILLKPFIMLALEPMLLAVTIYMSFVYGLLYLLFEAFPFVYIGVHHFNTLENGLAFLGFFLGGVVCTIFFMTVIEPRYLRYCKAIAPQPPAPEKRLELAVVCAWALVIAMFWFGWTGAYVSIHWICPMFAGGLMGVAVLGLFVSLFNYLVDVYLFAAASALAASTVFRSLFGAAFPLFATQMYDKLGIQWASSLLGFLALAMAPIPILFIKYGHVLREKSKFAPNL